MCMPSTIPILHSWDLGLTHRDKVVVTPNIYFELQPGSQPTSDSRSKKLPVTMMLNCGDPGTMVVIAVTTPCRETSP